MLRRLRNKKGFTMIELMIVAIIVAILAVVLIPLMTANKYRAFSTECEAALGTIRTALRVVQAEWTAPTAGFTGDPTSPIVVGAVEGNVYGIDPADLDGTYFSGDCYTVTAIAPATYTITCTWNSSVAPDAPKAAEINTLGFTTTINEQGTITRTGY